MADNDPSLYSLRYNQAASTLEAFGGGSPQWTEVTINNVDPQQVPVTRLINTTAPLMGGGNLTADRTLSIPQATGSVNGFLSSTDWTTFNNKLTSVLTSANIFVGNGSNLAMEVPVSGDVTLANTGVITLTSVNSNVGSFTNANITVDAKGRITAASSGADTGITQLIGDATAGPGSGTQALTLTTVNASPGTTIISTITTNGKGLVTANSSASTTGSGAVVLATSPVLVTPALGTPSSGILTNCSGGDLTDVGTDGIIITGGTGAVLGTGTSIAQHVADSTHNGYLSSTDWSTFNAKQPAGNYITALTGDVTASGPGSSAATLATVNGNVGSFTNASITVNAKGLITAASSGTAPVTSVSGTTNQITSTGGTTPVIAIANPVTFPGAMTAGGVLDMNSNKITNLTNGTAASDGAAFGQVKVIQTIMATTTTSTSSSSSTFVNITNAAVTITPTSASNRILIMASGCMRGNSNTTNNGWAYTLARGSTNLGSTEGFGRIEMNIAAASEIEFPVTMNYIDSPATTSATTYNIQARVDQGANGFNWASQNSTTVIIVMEIV